MYIIHALHRNKMYMYMYMYIRCKVKWLDTHTYSNMAYDNIAWHTTTLTVH